MDVLKRQLAPLLPEAWELIDEEARRVLRLHLAGRKLVGGDGPHGWKHAAVNLGRVKDLEDAPGDGVAAGLRVVRPLVEFRTGMRLDLAELDRVAHGLDTPDLEPVVAAAERMARAEDNALFNGYEAAGIQGLVASSPHEPIEIPEHSDEWPHVVVRAAEDLREAGINGPYALALGGRAFREVSQAAEDGYPIRHRVENVIDRTPVWTPALDGGVLMSVRGGDFQLTLGQDHSIGYEGHDRDGVDLFLTESFTFRVLEPAAAVVLRYADS
jgi:uncharacterized linocin/CFP29 family protein